MPSIACRICMALLWTITSPCSAQEDQDREIQNAAITAQRFLSIVEKNPQRGTALEKVFAHHLQLGTLDSFVADLEKRTTENSKDSVAWMLLGLFESQRRMDTQAIRAFAAAETLRPDDPLPAYYRGQCLLRIGEPTQAIEALEKAIARKPTRIVLLEVFELIGRTHQRQNRNDLAIDAWKRLEERFPNDLRVLEQIATIQNQEGAHGEALPRFERLISQTKDPFQRSQFRMEAAQLRLKLGASERGMFELQAVLSELRPDSWLYRDVQRKIEEVFLKANDLAGLISYYERRIDQQPDDIESMVRLSKFLVSSARIAEANQWMSKAIQRAPSRTDIRKTYIDQLVADQQFAAAIQEFEKLSKLDPKNADILRDWGKLVLRDPARSPDSAKQEASAIWNQIIDNKPDDALTHIQIAELHQLADMTDEAQKHLERAIELQPEESQYREFLGDFLFRQNQRERAYEVWNAIAEGARRSADSLMRLAEIYDHAQQQDTAAKLATQACELAPENSSMFVRAARFQKKADKMDDALNSLSTAEKFSDSADQREFILEERIHILEASNRLKSTTESLQAELRRDQNPSVEKLHLLARYLVRMRRWREANDVVHQALQRDQLSLAMLRLSADIADGLGDINQAIQSLRKLADSDKRKRQEYLERIARLYVRQKKWTDAIKTAEEVVAAMPSKIESYEFMAQICTQSKNQALAISTLRKALRIDPNSTRLTAVLASALIDHSNLNEAIELYWQSLTKANTLEEKLELTSKMVSAYEKLNSKSRLLSSLEYLSPLIDRLEAGRKDPGQRRDFTLCLAQVYQVTSNFEQARRTLEELNSDRTRDTAVLQNLVKLSLASNDLDLAIDYQRQLVALLPGQENESHLANLLRQHGDWSEANEIVIRLIQNEQDPGAAIKNIDSLIQRGEFELALETMEPLMLREPNHWELLFRVGIAHAGIDQWTKSRAAFERILTLDTDRNHSVALRPNASKRRNPTKATQPTPTSNNNPTSALDADAELLKRLDRPELTEIALGRARFAMGAPSGGVGSQWTPENLGEMRLASIAWLLHCDSKDPAATSRWIAQTLQKATESRARSDWIDAYAIVKLQQDIDAMVSTAAALAESGEPVMQTIFIDAVRRRQVSSFAVENTNRKPLTSSQLDLLVEAHRTEPNESAPNLLYAPSYSQASSLANRQSAQMAAMLSQMGNMPPADYMKFMQAMQRSMALSNAPTNFSTNRTDGSIRAVINELVFAGRAAQSEALIKEECETANTEARLSQLCEYLLSAQRMNLIERPLLRWLELQLQASKQTNTASTGPSGSVTTNPISNRLWNAPVEFAARFLEYEREPANFETATRILDSALEHSNQRYRDKDFAQIESRMFALAPANAAQSWCMYFVPAQEQRLLNAIENACAQSSRKDDWLTYLQSRVDREQGPLRALEQLRCSLSSERVTAPKQNSISVQDALLAISQEPGCELHAAATLLMRQDFGLTLKVAKAFSPSNSNESLLRELILLHAAAAVDDAKQLEASVSFLVNEKLDMPTRQSISGAVHKATALGIASAKSLQLNQSSGRVPVAATRNTPKITPSPEAIRAKEMGDYLKKGNQAEAIRMAKLILSRPRSFPPIPSSQQGIRNQVISTGRFTGSATGNIAQNASGSGYGGRAQSGRNAIGLSAIDRRAALDTLRETNELKNAIAETKQRLEVSPDSFALLEQLAEYHEFAGNTEQAIKAMSRALQLRPNASPLRIHLAEFLTDPHQDLACDQYLELVQRDPSSGLLILDQITILFEVSNRTPDLLKAIQSANFQSIKMIDDVLAKAHSLICTPQSFEVGATILQKLLEVAPTQRPVALRLMYSFQNKTYPRILDLVVDALIPTEFELLSDPWFGLHEMSFNAQTSGSSMLLESILSSHEKKDILEKLEPAISAAVSRMPGWLAGQVMLAIIDSGTQQEERAKNRYAALATLKRLHVGCPEAVAWKLSLVFEQQGENAAAIRMLDSFVGRSSLYSMQAGKQHVLILSKLLIADGKREKAIDAVNKALESGQLAAFIANNAISRGGPTGMNSFNVGNASPQKEPSLADSILKIGLPVEAYRLFDLQNGLSQFNAGMQQPQKTIVVSRQGEIGKQEAIAQLQKLTPDQAIIELLYDRSLPNQKLPALELMVSIPIAKDAASNQMESELQTRLIQIAKTGKQPEIEQRLTQLALLHPNDVSIHATLARVRLATGKGDAKAPLQEIERIIPSRSSMNDQQLILSLWLVARDCYQAGQHFAFADSLAERAMKAASLLDRIPLAEFSPEGTTPLSPAGAKRLKYTFERANHLLLEWGGALLKSGNTAQGIEKWEELVGRLGAQSHSAVRFELQFALASRAAEAGQMEMATRISSNITHLSSVANTPRIPYALVQKTLATLKTDSQRVDFLLSIIFGPERAIMLQADEVELLRDPPQNLGEPLVLYASQSNRLKEINSRLGTSPPSLDLDVLKTQVAIAIKDYETAEVHLGAMFEVYQKTRSLENLQKICNVAIPAFRIEALRKSTIPILNALLQRERDRLRLPTAEFNALPLVVEIDDYLRSKK